MFTKIKVRYYLWKLKRKKTNIQTVAVRLSVSNDKVAEEYNKYIDPFKKTNYGSLIAICISLGSLLIAIYSVYELKQERELRYKPDLRVYENTISLYWDNDGIPIKREDDYTRNYQIDKNNHLFSLYLNIDNIGTDNARDIKYDWNYDKNIETFRSFLEGSNMDVSILKEENVFEVDYAGRRIARTRIDPVDLESYISQNMKKQIMIPSIYLELLSGYCYEKLPLSEDIEYNNPLTMQDFPQIILSISYKDIQGQEIKKNIESGFDPIIYEKNIEGNGNCHLRIRSLNEYLVEY